MKKIVGVGVLIELARHRPHQQQIIRMLRNVGKQVTDLVATLPVSLEVPRRFQRIADTVELGPLHRFRERLLSLIHI